MIMVVVMVVAVAVVVMVVAVAVVVMIMVMVVVVVAPPQISGLDAATMRARLWHAFASVTDLRPDPGISRFRYHFLN